MNYINLINPDESSVEVKVSTFPDGEKHIKIGGINRKDEAIVVARICNADDLFILMQVNDILTRQGVEWNLCLTYLMSMRMDRVINFDEAFSLNVVASIINNFSYNKVTVFHPHSNRTLSFLRDSSDDAIDNNIFDEAIKNAVDYDVVCYPDAGAHERYSKSEKRVICLKKTRDLEHMGAIKSIEFDGEEQFKYIDCDAVRTILVEDDLCDAGGTFAWSAKVLRERFPNVKLCIAVRHMVNPRGIENLASTYDEVYFTNSYKDWDVSAYKNVHVLNVC